MNMHLALLTNAPYLDEHLTAFNHLVVGLIDEGVRLVQIAPERVETSELSIFGDRFNYRESTFTPITRHRILSLGERLDELEVSVVMAMHGGLWRYAAELAKRHDFALVLNAQSGRDVRRLHSVMRLLRPTQTVMLAPTQPILDALEQELRGTVQCRLAPPGVHLPGEDALPQARSEPPAAPCVIVSTTGELTPEVEAMMRGLPEVIEAHPEAQFFLDGQSTSQHELWKLASRLDILSHVSMIPRKLGHRKLLLKADLFIQPQAMGAARSLSLQTMAHAIPMIAQDDPWLDYLLENVTCRLVDQPQPEEWTQLIRRLLGRRDEALQLGRHARAYVREHHTMSNQVARTLEVCRRLTGESLAFPAA